MQEYIVYIIIALAVAHLVRAAFRSSRGKRHAPHCCGCSLADLCNDIKRLQRKHCHLYEKPATPTDT